MGYQQKYNNFNGKSSDLLLNWPRDWSKENWLSIVVVTISKIIENFLAKKCGIYPYF